MQIYQFRVNAIRFLWLLALLPACTMVPESSAPPISSTRGTTLVRMATVLDVQELSPATQAGSTQLVTVRFDDGQTAHYELSTRPPLQQGERVTVSDNLGKVHISRQLH